jgi:murein DD-endopeptidase MepM/ murein hydrolase activator NlpD
MAVSALVAVLAVIAATTAAGASPGTVSGARSAADADPTPTLRRVTFPVAGSVSYWNDFGACRDGCTRRHEGNDLMGARLQRLLAASDGRIVFTRTDASGLSGNMLILEDDAGWQYYYIHLNNDSPGTDDGANPRKWILAPGVRVGDRVDAGQHIAFMGDSGNAEGTSPHVHFELHRPDGTAVSAYHSLRLSQGLTADPWCRYPSNPRRTPRAAAGRGYWLLEPGGRVRAYGDAEHFGSARRVERAGAVVDIAPTPSGAGYWIVTSAGELFAYGDARRRGDLAGADLAAPIVGLDVTPTGRGYWMFAADGGVFTFGDAEFFGSTGAMRLEAPVVGMATTKTGEGYWLFAQDGGVFTFGDAEFFGSTGHMRLHAPIIGMVRSGGGAGYLLLGRDGGTFTFGDAAYRGSLPGFGWCSTPTARSLVPTTTGRGYWILATTGRIYAFGDAPLHGDPSEIGGRPVAMAVVPRTG